MRALVLLPLMLPLPALAADIAVPSRVASATVFPQGATIERAASFTAPAGRHRLILQDIPLRDLQGLRIEAEGVTLGAVTLRDDLAPPRDAATREVVAAAEAEVERLEQALESARDAARAIRLEAEAAAAQIAFLRGLGSADGIAAAGVDTLRDLARMVGEETLAAERRALEAEIRAREAEQATAALMEDLARARQTLRALDVEAEAREYLALSVDVPEAVEGALTIRYVTGAAGWRPVYDFHLDRGGAPALTIGRGAYVSQWTGESWQDVALALSTMRPSGQTEPGEVYPDLRRIEGPEAQERTEKAYGAAADEAEAGRPPMPMPEPVVAVADYDGLSVTYSYPEPVTLATGAEDLRITLGTLEVTPKVGARAVPLRDGTAFLMAEFTNDTDEIILPSDQSEFYLDGVFVGLRPTGLIAAGDAAAFSFGPIEGLRLTRRVLDRSEGDRGVISRSNRQAEAVEIEIRNFTGEAWNLRLIDRVPYSEQEDLEVRWTATPEPAETDLDGARGILAWDLALAPGATEVVRLDHVLTWPANKVLR